MMKTDAKKISLYGMLLALSMVLSYVEAILPLHIGIQGAKLGLPNLVTMIGLYGIGPMPTLVISLLRILLVSFLFGNTMTLAYSFSGFLLSFLLMLAMQRVGGFRRTIISVFGAVMHNLGQLLAAMVLLHSSVLLYYFPMLLIAGILAGAVIGLAAGWITERILPFLRKG